MDPNSALAASLPVFVSVRENLSMHKEFEQKLTREEKTQKMIKPGDVKERDRLNRSMSSTQRSLSVCRAEILRNRHVIVESLDEVKLLSIIHGSRRGDVHLLSRGPDAVAITVLAKSLGFTI